MVFANRESLDSQRPNQGSQLSGRRLSLGRERDAQIVKHLDGRLEIRGGSDQDKFRARDWMENPRQAGGNRNNECHVRS